MSVGVLIITHGEIGNQLVDAASSTLGGKMPLHCQALTITQSCDPDSLVKEAESIVESLNDGNGVLVLTDIYGSTPSNIANRLGKSIPVKIIAGVNLPMLIRILNYPDLELMELTEKALSGGHDGIILCNGSQ